MFLSVEIKNLLREGLIKEPQHEKGEYISPIFWTPKSDGSFRMILNIKKLNDHMPYIHFKVETIKSVLNLVTPNCYMKKIDIKDAYYSISILPEHQKFLKFSLPGKLYKFICPPLAKLRLDRLCKNCSIYWWFNSTSILIWYMLQKCMEMCQTLR